MTNLRILWAFLLLGFVAPNASADYLRYEFVFNEFRESAGPFAPYEQMTGYVEADVNLTTGAFNSYLGGQVTLTGGPTTTDITGEQFFGEYRFYGTPLGLPIDSAGGIFDFYLTLNITGGPLNPTLGAAATAYSPPSHNQNFVYDLQNGNHTIQVFTTPLSNPVPEPASLLLLGIGITGLSGYSWRRKRNPESAS